MSDVERALEAIGWSLVVILTLAFGRVWLGLP